MSSEARVPVSPADRNKVAPVIGAQPVRKSGLPGEMALQNLFGHPATQSIQQGLVRLVGHRAPVRPGPTGRTAT
ncbi:hypothetical protein LPW26_07235 [Rhodopseudomonas sp. HC1]|uniref:hypothetical protein n=1 Tax=Rhodopseudomonas infernalis TaxID=2897386 RepID=UPI001EE9506A|nr:hypothetical protein [Rhodopseudomonas infernalis]MCG6204422.1 hypothetical protein [Rhodopseudomonas infernalis]